jgi:hypothetical protein
VIINSSKPTKCFNEMHGLYIEFEATLPATNRYFITADQTLFLHLICGGVLFLVDLVFMLM